MKTKHYIFLFISLLSLGACTEIVDVDLEEAGDSKLVVFAEITDEPMQHAVNLSLSTSYFYNEETPTVSGATVTINDGFDTITLTEDLSNPGTYLTPEDYAGVIGRTYNLLIENVDADNDGVNEIYTAETKMMSTPPVNNVEVEYNSSWEGWEVKIDTYDPAETADFYLFKVYKNDVLYSDTISNYWTTDDRFFNGSLIENTRVQYFNEDRDEIVNDGDKVTLEMAGITEDYFNFINEVIEEVSDKIPMFSGPAANVNGNISNGALGFFAVIKTEQNSCIYNGE